MEKSIEEKPQTLTIKETTSIDNFKKGVDTLLAQRDYFIKQVLPKLKEKQDYYTILGKKSLAKGGAEKLASIYNLVATFEKDAETVQMLGEIKGMVCYICNLSRDDKIIGQGRGADTLQRNQNDPNKTIKMAQKRAYVDAVIRTTGLSDIFTQDMCPEDRPDLWNENGTQEKVSVQIKKWERQAPKMPYNARNYQKGNIPPTKQAIINQKAKQAPELTPIQKLSIKLKENGCYDNKTKKFDDTKVIDIISAHAGIVVSGQAEASKMAKEILELWK